MSTVVDWPILQSSVESALAADPRPIARVADGDVAAIVIRRAFPPEECPALVRLLIDEGLMYETGDPRIAENSLTNAVVGKYLGRGANPDASPRKRIDVGASLGNFGDDRDDFFRRSDEAHALFDRLFAGRPNPIRVLYETLSRLCPANSR